MSHEGHHFKGDIDRNEVQLDLNKFLDLMYENNKLKEKIRDLELEDGRNPWVRWVHMARTVNEWRVFPRIFFLAYIALFVWSGAWFMGLVAPSPEQSAFLAIIVGAGAAWFNAYTKTGNAVVIHERDGRQHHE